MNVENVFIEGNTQIENILEGKKNVDRFPIGIGMLSKDEAINKNHGLYPMQDYMSKEEELTTKYILDKLEQGDKPLYQAFFLNGDLTCLSKLINRTKRFRGYIKTKYGKYSTFFVIKQNNRYQRMIDEMSLIFEKNGRQFREPCLPYICRMFEVFIDETELVWYEEVESISIDYEEFTEYVTFDVIPAWNIEKISVVTDLLPQKVSDGVYKHIINRKRIESTCPHLIDEDVKIFNVTQRGNIEIFCDDENERIWKLYKLGKFSSENLQYEIFSNDVLDENIKKIPTIGGISRYIKNLGYNERFELLYIKETRKRDLPKQQLKVVFTRLMKDNYQNDILQYIMRELCKAFPTVEFLVEVQ